MTPYEQFKINKDAAAIYARTYLELRQLKLLGSRGTLSEENKYLLWLPRAGVVGAVGALDHYVHQVLYEKIPEKLRGNPAELPESLCDLILRVASLKNAVSVRENIHFVQSATGPDDIAVAIRDKVLQFEAFQAPDKIVRAFAFLGYADILEDISATWQGPNTDRRDIAKRLDQYVKRRNQIAHEGDLQSTHRPRPITPMYASDCLTFVFNLVWRLNGILYGLSFEI